MLQLFYYLVLSLLSFDLVFSTSIKCKESHIVAPYGPGGILPNAVSDWDEVTPLAVPLYSIDQTRKFPYDEGQITVRAYHDGQYVFVNVKFVAPFTPGNHDGYSTPSVALMIQIGNNATIRMGGCPSNTCWPCRGYEVDLTQFNIADNLPGHISPASDMYAFSPRCRFYDGHNYTQNTTEKSKSDWIATWHHTSIRYPAGGFIETDWPFGSEGATGAYVVTFMRPLQTLDIYRQDAQIPIGSTFYFSVAVWVPVDGAWAPSGHYITCNWLSMSLKPSTLFSMAAYVQVKANTVLATVLPVVAIVFTMLLCCYMKAYIRHVKRELTLRQAIPDLNMDTGSLNGDHDRDNEEHHELHRI